MGLHNQALSQGGVATIGDELRPGAVAALVAREEKDVCEEDVDLAEALDAHVDVLFDVRWAGDVGALDADGTCVVHLFGCLATGVSR